MAAAGGVRIHFHARADRCGASVCGLRLRRSCQRHRGFRRAHTTPRHRSDAVVGKLDGNGGKSAADAGGGAADATTGVAWNWTWSPLPW
mmetsp:Transcript_6363/g.24735  ORF Transcript_6363/g.24735 Transcript_6363/m.24735 type:complete len:89 (-) Transcript_6363:5-271(-)